MGVMAGPWLVDKSALVRLAHHGPAPQWDEQTERGLIRICTATLLEIGFSAQSVKGHRASLDHPPISLMPVEFLTPAAERRAVQVQRLLAERGQHRAPSAPDLLIAAVAEQAGLTVLHDDKDFELIAAVTGQETERLS